MKYTAPGFCDGITSDDGTRQRRAVDPGVGRIGGGIGEEASGGVHLVLGTETALRTVAARGVGIGAVNTQCVAAGGLAWSAVREGQCEEAVLEPAHANLLEASVFPTVHVLTNHRVEIGVGLPKQRHVTLIAGCGAEGISVIAASRSVVGVGLEVPNNHIGVAAAKGFCGQGSARSHVGFWGGVKVDQSTESGDGQTSGRKKCK